MGRKHPSYAAIMLGAPVVVGTGVAPTDTFTFLPPAPAKPHVRFAGELKALANELGYQFPDAAFEHVAQGLNYEIWQRDIVSQGAARAAFVQAIVPLLEVRAKRLMDEAALYQAAKYDLARTYFERGGDAAHEPLDPSIDWSSG